MMNDSDGFTHVECSIQNILNVCEMIEGICKYLSPCDVYNLCLTSKQFHQSTQDNPCYTKLLMRQTLESSLTKGLLNTGVHGFTLSSFQEFSNLCPPNTVAISGGTIVKAALDQSWSSDLDLYTTRNQAKKVRTWLIKNCGLVLKDYAKFYSFLRSPSVLIVETYTTMPIDGTEFIDSKDGERWTFRKDHLYVHNIDVPVDAFDTFTIKTTDDGNTLPYEPRLKHRTEENKSMTIDLIVARTGRSVDDMLNDFDLSICQNKYNGKSFQVFHPFKTFNRTSVIQRSPHCFDFIQIYTKNLIELCQIGDTLSIVLDVGKMITFRCNGLTVFKATYDSGGLFTQEHTKPEWQVQMYCGANEVSRMRGKIIRRALLVTQRDTPFLDDLSNEYDLKNIDLCDAVKVHNDLISRVSRMIKYTERGINIEGAPQFQSDITRDLPEQVYDEEIETDSNESEY